MFCLCGAMFIYKLLSYKHIYIHVILYIPAYPVPKLRLNPKAPETTHPSRVSHLSAIPIP